MNKKKVMKNLLPHGLLKHFNCSDQKHTLQSSHSFSKSQRRAACFVFKASQKLRIMVFIVINLNGGEKKKKSVPPKRYQKNNE
jgi:hypothetical protein